MLPLTERQRRLLAIIQQLNRNLLPTDNVNTNSFLDLGLDFDFDLSLGGNRGGRPIPPGTSPSPNVPSSMRELFASLEHERVEITVPFGTVIGTVISVQNDYVVVVTDAGEQVLVPYENIELVNQL